MRYEQSDFSGVAKTYHEIEAALDADIKCFNIESPAELDRVIAVAQKKGKKARVSFRVNPDVDAKTHPTFLPVSRKTNSVSPTIRLSSFI